MPTPNAPPDAAVARFRADVHRLTGGAATARIGIAVSGGPDSMAALLLAQAAFPGRVEAATVDHGLRTASADEAALVARACARRPLPHETLHVAVARRGNVSANARAARYAALDAWRIRRELDWIVTAHHAEDQLETMIMRLNRASGVGGLAGIRAKSGTIIRPLLQWRRTELAAICKGLRVRTVADPSNTDDRFDRARLRKVLASVDWIDPVAVAQSAANLADADEALEWVATRWRSSVTLPVARVRIEAVDDMPWELRRRTWLDSLLAIDPDAKPRAETIARLDAAMRARRTMTVGRVIFRPSDNGVYVELAPPRR